MSAQTTGVASAEKTLLIVEDDKPFLQRLASAMQTRGFAVTTAESRAEGLQHVEQAAPAFAVVDMRLGDGNGLDVISALKRNRPEARAIILTGYGNIATAVNAVKLVRWIISRSRWTPTMSSTRCCRGEDRKIELPSGSDVGGSRAVGTYSAHL